MLAGGFLILSLLHGRTDAQVREGARMYNSAERALIDEIRRETSTRIEAKENEIFEISTKLADIDTELQELHSSNQELSAEQRSTEKMLIAMQDEYLVMLETLQNERSRILEEARAREASLQAQLENRTRELTLVTEQSAAAVEFARSEMDRLSREQSHAATAEAQMGALFANLSAQLGENRFDEAAETIKTMRRFVNTPAFQSLRSIQERKELYTQAINSFDRMIEEARRNQAGGILPSDRNAERTITELQGKNAQLELELTELNKAVEIFTMQDTGLTQRLAELEGTASALRSENSALETSSAAKDSRIAGLETSLREQTQNAESSRQATDALRTENETLSQTVSAHETTIETLNSQLTQIRQALQVLSNQ